MTNENEEKRFQFDLDLEIKYKTKYTKNHKIVYFVLDDSDSYPFLIELRNVLKRLGYKKKGGYVKNSNALKLYLKTRRYEEVYSAPDFKSITSPKNRFPDFIKERVLNDE